MSNEKMIKAIQAHCTSMISPKMRRALKRIVKSVNDKRDDVLQRKQQLAARIAECAEDGKVAMVWYGMDCDGVQYSGSVRVVPASVVAVNRDAEHVYLWADGPCGYYIERPSVAIFIEYASRDLAMEAYENGHAHCLHV